jgi:DNA mismatch repair protein MutL
VTDNGYGMSREDAVRALERHATSKIRTVSDLFDIGTLGFRGEALPSIASVSRFALETRERGALVGTRIEVEGGKLKSVRDAGVPEGTRIEVRDLFFNTPARLKFMKNDSTELRHLSEALLRVALSRYDAHFRLTHNDRRIMDVPANTSLGDRALALFGRETREGLFDTADYPPIEGIRAWGLTSRPDLTQRSTSRYYVYVNGRFVKDKTIYAAIKGAYRGVMEPSRFPMVVLFVDVPPKLVDVNVHPSKIEVRFTDSDSVYRSVYHAIQDTLQVTPWVDSVTRTYTLKPKARTIPGLDAAGEGARTVEPLNARFAQVALPIGEHRRPAEPLRIPIADIFGPPKAPAGAPRPPVTPPPVTVDPFAPQPARGAVTPPAPLSVDTGRTVEIRDEAAEAEARALRMQSEGYFSRLRYIGQFKRAYLVCEDASGLVIVDQHAAHERIGFERLRKQYATEHRESQQLLVPERISLDALRSSTLAGELPFFERLGFELEPFGGTDWALKAIPALLARGRYAALIKDALDDLGNLGRSDRIDEARDAVFARMACHAVIRAGDALTAEEVLGLFKQMDAIDFGANCPHGRPVYFRLPLAELEDAFGRT